jgi:prepilin-type N-terminal cleavage/methylation domain-containing protein
VKKTRGFTLIELLIASSIFLILMIGVYSSFRTGMLGYSNISETIETTRAGRQILERVDLDLRNCFAFSQDSTKFLGTSGEISFLTLAQIFTDGAMSQQYAYISYKLERNKLTRLLRYGKESLNENSLIVPEEMNSDIKSISFSYGYPDANTKSLQFKDSWGKDSPTEQKKLPAAVRIKLSIKMKADHNFERFIYLPMGIQ